MGRYEPSTAAGPIRPVALYSGRRAGYVHLY
jgi:hypothetical protein